MGGQAGLGRRRDATHTFPAWQETGCLQEGLQTTGHDMTPMDVSSIVCMDAIPTGVCWCRAWRGRKHVLVPFSGQGGDWAPCPTPFPTRGVIGAGRAVKTCRGALFRGRFLSTLQPVEGGRAVCTRGLRAAAENLADATRGDAPQLRVCAHGRGGAVFLDK